MAPRETIMQALLAVLAAIPGVVLASRRFRIVDDVATSECPAVFVVQKSETSTRDPNFPAKRELKVDIFVYVKTDQSTDAVPASELNPIVDAIEEAIAPFMTGERQTLGGLAHHVRIDGDIEFDQGFFQTAAAAVIPVSILVP